MSDFKGKMCKIVHFLYFRRADVSALNNPISWKGIDGAAAI